MRKLMLVLAMIPVLALGACSNIPFTISGGATNTPVTSDTPTTTTSTPDADDPEATDDPVNAPDPIVVEDLPMQVPASTGPANIIFTRTLPKASKIILSSHAVTTIAMDGTTTLGTYVLPGDLYTLLMGLTTAMGNAPVVVDNAPYSYDYTWGAIVVTDYSPSVTQAGDPPFKITISARSHYGVQLLTVNGIQVGNAAVSATSIADEVIDGSGYYWASIDAFHVAMPGVADGRIYTEISALSGAGNITQIRGPTGSWTN